MPKTEPVSTSSTGGHVDSPPLESLHARVASAEERTLDYWIEAVSVSAAGSMTVKTLQQSFSWRVTKPLRAAKLVYSKARESGIRRTVLMVRERLAQIRQARKRG